MVQNTPLKWRQRLGKKNSKKLRKILTFILALECLCGVILAGRPPVSFQTEYRWQREWTLPHSGNGDQSSDTYGVWLDRKTWQLQFYHTRQSINDH